MLSQTDAVKQAWAATDRTLDIIVTVDGTDYQATEINSLNYDAGAFTGDTLGIGSTYENSVTIEFSSVVEAFKQGLTVLPKVGVLVNGKFEYTSLGTFIVSEVNRDRNNNLTTIKALDQMCKLEGQYKPTVSDMASPLDIIADIANQGGVTVNTGELQHLPAFPNIKKIEGQTLRTAIGWIAQLYGGFAAFDRDGKLTIRTTATPDYTITPGEYQQGGLTKNEVSYKTGGIKVTVNTKKTDDSGQEVDDTTMLQAGETTGSQIELTNDSMTSDLLTTVWTGIKDITYYPYTLNWFGNPNLEAGDWVTLTDTQGNQFNVPVNQYTMSFNGGLESTISATQSSSSAGGYAYTGSAGSIKNMIEALQVRNTASGNNVYPPSYQGQPNNPKKGDVWYKQNGNNIEVWIYQEENGTLAWVRTPLDGEVKAELQTLGKKTDEDLTRVKNELSSEAEGQWQSMKEATSKVASDLSAAKDSLATVKSDLSATKSSLNSGLDAVKSDLSATKSSLNTVASDLSTAKNDLTNVSKDLSDTKSNLGTVSNDLSETKNNLATVTDDLSKTKSNLADTGQKLETAVSDFQKKTDQLSGSLETANSKIEFNSKAISEVKQTAEEISTTVNDHSGQISQLQQTASGLQSRVGSAEGNISAVTQTANAVKTDLADAKGNISQLQERADSLTSTLKNGGANLLNGTSDTEITNTYPTIGQSDKVWYQMSVPANQTDYVLSFDAKATVAGDKITCYMYNPNQVTKAVSSQNVTTLYADGNMQFSLTTDWVRYWVHYTIKPTSQSPSIIVGRTYPGGSGTVSFKCVQLEYGSTPTPWSPSSGDISQLQQTASGLTSRIGSAEGNISSLQQTASGLQSTVSNIRVGGRNLLKNSIKFPFSGNISDNSWDTVLWRIAGSTTDDNMRRVNKEIADSPYGKANAISFTGTLSSSINDISLVAINSIPLSGKVTVSFWARQISNVDTAFVSAGWSQMPMVDTNASTDVWGTTQYRKLSLPKDGSWTRFWATFNVSPGQNVYVGCGNTGTSAEVQICLVKIESGTMATDWTPAPEDTDQAISKVSQTADAIRADLTNTQGDVASVQATANSLTSSMSIAQGDISTLQQTAGGLTTRVSNAEGNISSIQETAKELKATVGDDNTGLISSVKAIPGQISSAITASKQATVVTSAVDVHNMITAGYYLLKGTLTNSPVDAWAFLRVITSAGGDRIYHQIWKDSASTVYTEEWTGSWSDWAMHINSENLKSNVITAINQSTEGVSITGAKITLDGNVNITPGFTLSADYIKAGTLSADRISGGTLDLSKNITVKDLTANSISSGSISGQNLNINLDNGVVEFTKGNLHSTDGGFNISIDTKSFYLDTGNGSQLWIDSNGFHLQESASQHLWMNKDGLHNYTDTNGNGIQINDTTLKVLNSSNAGLIAKDGMLQFSANPVFNSDNVYSGTLDSQTYGTIGFNSNLLSSSLNGIFIKGREGVVIGTNSYNGGKLLAPADNFPIGAGAGINLPDGADKPASIFTNSALTLFAGTKYSDGVFNTPMSFISIGCNWYYTHEGTAMDLNGTGERGAQMYAKAKTISFDAADWINLRSIGGAGRIALDAQYVHSYPTYNQTTSAGANVFVAPDGALIRSSSARKYKTDIQDADNDYGAKLIEFTPQKWIDKAEKKRYEEDPDNNKKPGYYYGLIADDLDAAGLGMLVNYGAEGEVEGINYDRLAVALLPVIKSLKDQVARLKEQLKA